MPLSGISSLKEDLLCCCNNMDTHLTALLMKGKASVTTLKHSREQLTFTYALPYSYNCMFRLKPYTYTNTHNHLMLILCQICVHDSFIDWFLGQMDGLSADLFSLSRIYITGSWKGLLHIHENIRSMKIMVTWWRLFLVFYLKMIQPLLWSAFEELYGSMTNKSMIKERKNN